MLAYLKALIGHPTYSEAMGGLALGGAVYQAVHQQWPTSALFSIIAIIGIACSYREYREEMAEDARAAQDNDD